MTDLGFSFALTESGTAVEARILRHDLSHLRTRTGRYLLSTGVMTFEEAQRHHTALGKLLAERKEAEVQPEFDLSDVL